MTAVVVGLVLGVLLFVVCEGVTSLMRAEARNDASLKNTVDHLCRAPRSSYVLDHMVNDDYDFKQVRPGAVWTCPDCLTTWVLDREGHRWMRTNDGLGLPL